MIPIETFKFISPATEILNSPLHPLIKNGASFRTNCQKSGEILFPDRG
jgi:hypothetical protein